MMEQIFEDLMNSSAILVRTRIGGPNNPSVKRGSTTLQPSVKPTTKKAKCSDSETRTAESKVVIETDDDTSPSKSPKTTPPSTAFEKTHSAKDDAEDRKRERSTTAGAHSCWSVHSFLGRPRTMPPLIITISRSKRRKMTVNEPIRLPSPSRAAQWYDIPPPDQHRTTWLTPRAIPDDPKQIHTLPAPYQNTDQSFLDHGKHGLSLNGSFGAYDAIEFDCRLASAVCLVCDM